MDKWGFRELIIDEKEQLKKLKKLMVIKESLTDYVEPILVIGNIDWLLNSTVTIVSLMLPKEEFAILNDKIPSWVLQVRNKRINKENILVMTDFDKISIEKQELLLEILKDNKISSEDLPENLKIVLHARGRCNINPKIRDLIECYEYEGES